MMITNLKRLLIGSPLATERQMHERLNKRTALAVFSSDALSSVAYATEAILAVLLASSAASVGLSLPVAAGIAALLLTVAFSYRQTIHAYPSGGGAYIVAHENLGQMAGLVAAAALLIDYVLTVAVSVSAGVAAITSLGVTWGVPWLHTWAVEIALACIGIITLVNLRGVRESGMVFAIPTYVFVLSMLAMIIVGTGQFFFVGTAPVQHTVESQTITGNEYPVGMILVWLVMRAFAAGCTALTGIEAISNGVQAFKPPESKNAATTLTWMTVLLTTMFVGITWLAHQYGVIPHSHETVVSQIARTVFGPGFMYGVIQVATALILVLAANTAFADFPRLASLLALDGFLPRQLSSRGDRLVFSNGILLLGMFSALLVGLFHANEIAMLPLYAIGVFISFTLSQIGMVVHHMREKEPGWRHGLLINALGGVLTAVVLVILILTKVTHGAWAVLILVPILVLFFLGVHRHYRRVANQLSLQGIGKTPPIGQHRAIVLVGGLHRGTLPALRYAQAIAPGNVTAVYVNIDPAATAKMRQRWEEWSNGVPLVVLDSPYRSLLRPILNYLDEIDQMSSDSMITVVLPEFVPAHWWEYFLHNQSALPIKLALMYGRGRVVTTVPSHLTE